MRQGLPLDSVCDYLGIAQSTATTWRHRGERYLAGGSEPEEDAIYGEFVLQTRRALARYKLKLVRELHDDENRNWVRPLAILERRDRDSFGRNEPAGGSEEDYDPNDEFL
jgi:hypothetical protein